ncbi:hypothetical protein VFPPC_14245 [Pochonia chlamydosporia 170]|uniref:DUF7735 domain-containing protein n=1 Tax=Pochonia chlamydosporia 170 TaxID=1380566 RepID=A0A179FKG8_METCM|nr:hypothetical protein VFPPC_14245 [Pochonia chlamydosporia 170]OAQ65838.1 hypothetical protein VFPPC_14245 [Pochonia chlamydosporia 170]
MQTKVILAALAGTTFASQLQPRQTDIGAATACLSLLGSMPTPPPALTQEFIKNPPKDYCSITVPASLSSDWSSYTSAAASWIKEHSSDLAKCPGADQIKSKSPVDCKAANGGGSQTTGGSDATNTGSGAAASKTGAAARETGMAFAAVAAAGFALAAL